MKKAFRALAAALLAACLCTGAASAGVPGLDSALSDYLDLNDDVRFSFGMELGALAPFGEATVAMMNGILKHVRAGAELHGGEETLRLSVDGAEMLSLTQTATDGGTELQTSLLQNRTLQSAGSAMDVFSGNAAGEEPAFDALKAISEVQGCYRALTDAIAPYAEEKKASYKIKSIGAAKWSRVARLTPEQSTQLSPLIAAVLGCGMDAAYRERLSGLTYAKGFVVALYQSAENGKDMAVYMKGSVAFPDGETRKLAYQWAFTDAGTERRDTYKFELTKTKAPADNRVIAASYDQQKFSDRFAISGKCDTTLKADGKTVQTTVTHELSGKDANGARDVSGTQTTAVKTTADGKTDTLTTTLRPALALTSAEGSGVLSGNVQLKEELNKKVQTDVTFTFDDQPAQALSSAAASGELFAVSEEPTENPSPMPQSSLAQNAEALEPTAEAAASDYLVGKAPVGLSSYQPPQTMQTLNLDSLTSEELEALKNELSQNLAGRLLVALSALPEEDAALLRDNMSEADYAAFLALVNAL